MNVEVTKTDVDPFLWLQRLIERRLIRETFRRARSAGVLDPKADSLWCAEVWFDQYGGDDHIFVSHDISTGPHRRDRKNITEKFTLAVALRLCMTEEEEP